MPKVAGWPLLRDYVAARPGAGGHTIWSYPLHAGQALGAPEATTFPGAAAIYAAMLAIHLVDDLLDKDDRGFHHEIGVGGAANLASALQGVSHALLAEVPLPAEATRDMQQRLGVMFLETAQGQSLDQEAVHSEQDYWAALEAKTPPLLAAALAIGARLAGADGQQADALASLADDLACLIQVGDDVADATAVPARADWRPGAANLPIFYARTAEHPQRRAFIDLAARAPTDSEALQEAQEILLRSGAISYGVHVMLERAKTCRRAIEGLGLPTPDALAALVDSLIAPPLGLLATGDDEADAVPGSESSC